jgi:CO/xanthine dehydrogenase Mo-binding subunit
VETTFMLETAIEHISSLLGLRPEVVRQLNMYSDGDYTLYGQYLISCNATSIFKSLQVRITAFVLKLYGVVL